jgi:hypothetical protein
MITRHKIASFFIFTYIVSSPFYVFPSGLPQISDIILLLAFIVMIPDFFGKYIYKYRGFRYLYMFLLLTIIVNLSYSFIHWGVTDSAFELPIFNSLYYLYNIIVCGIVFNLLIKYGSLFENLIIKALILSIAIQIVLISFALTGNLRNFLFFNNPNQLAYYGTLVLTIWLVSDSHLKSNIFFSLIITLSSLLLVVLSGSRIALPFAIFASVFGLFMNMKISFFKGISLLVGISTIVGYLLINNVLGINDFITFTNQRIEDTDISGASFIAERGYDKIVLYPEYIFFGAGEGLFERFEKSYHELEIHSFFASVLFSYGILGILFISKFLKIITKKIEFRYFIFLLPILAFNFVHQGGRFTLLWILFSLIYYTSLKKINFR